LKELLIYTDGACSGNPGPGGYGIVMLYKEFKKEISGGEAHTTNNRMELTGPIVALEALKEPCIVKLYSDSAYLCNTFNQHWIYGWMKNGWQTASKKPVENRDLWERLYALTKLHKVEFIKVKGHADNVYNNRCDALARAAIKDLKSDQ